jgi:hypothetical protein
MFHRCFFEGPKDCMTTPRGTPTPLNSWMGRTMRRSEDNLQIFILQHCSDAVMSCECVSYNTTYIGTSSDLIT